MFYVTSDDNFAFATFTAVEGWDPVGCSSNYLDFSQLEQFTISQQSQSLSATVLTESSADWPNFGVLLMFHDSNEFPVLLYGTEQKVNVTNVGYFEIAIVWTNVTDQLHSALGPGIPNLLNGVFSNFAYGGDNRTSSITMTFPEADREWFLLDIVGQMNASNCKYYQEGCNLEILELMDTWVAPTISLYANRTAENSGQFNYLTLAMNASANLDYSAVYHISNDSLIPDMPYNGGNSTGFFPFNSTAVMIPSGTISNKVYIYHQINGSAFGEEIYSADAMDWSSNTIGVETST